MDQKLDSELLQAMGETLAVAPSVCVVQVDRVGCVRFADSVAARALGAGGGPAVGADLRTLVLPEDRSALDRLLAADETSEPVLLRFADGGPAGLRALVVSATPLGPDQGDGVLLVGRDASAEIVREARVRSAERFEIVGQIARGVAHELNNALSTVTTFSDLLLADAEPGSGMAEDLSEIKAAALDAAAIIRKLDLFAGDGRPSGDEGVHLPDIAEGTRKLLSRFLTREVTLTLESDDATPAVAAAPLQLEEIIFALAANAKEALSADGVVAGSVTLSVRPGGRPEAPTALLEMVDTGTGPRVPAADAAVEAFFSTKPLSEGTGIGLAVVDRIVRGLGGTFRLESRPGGGTVATVELPAGGTGGTGEGTS